jgi:predicted ATP-grasp superfamily ATP-dependent carboligase
MVKRRILITEYVMSCYGEGGGIYRDLLPEALAMVKSLEEALTHVGIDAYVTVSEHLKEVMPLFRNTVGINPTDCINELTRLVDGFDNVIAIAPPRELMIIADTLGEKLIQQPPNLVKELSSKYGVIKYLEGCGVKVPKTIMVNTNNLREEINNALFKAQFVIKPALLAGSECVYVVRDGHYDADRVMSMINDVIKCDPSGNAVLQEYVEGVHGSVSVIYGANGPSFYSLNLQLIRIENDRLSFLGGVLPVRDYRVVNEARGLIDAVYRCFPGIRGYVGFDVVWNEAGVYVVEANMRPTTSIVSISQLYPELGRHIISDWGWPLIYLGDVTTETAYYLVLDKGVDVETSNTRTIGIGGASKRVVVGKERSIGDVYRVIKPLLGNLAYDIEQVIK